MQEPFPEEWEILLAKDLALWNSFDEDEKAKLRDDIRIFSHERTWEGCGGIELSMEMKVLIAAQACLMTLGRTVDAWDSIRSILVYPDAYKAPFTNYDEGGIVRVGKDDREGESWSSGYIILSWKDAYEGGFLAEGRNLVIHEFAHQVDLLTFLETAIPRKEDIAIYEWWEEVTYDSFTSFVKRFDAGLDDPALDSYGATNEAEFFAVAAESFFETPKLLKSHHRNLYAVLSEYFNQDPAAR